MRPAHLAYVRLIIALYFILHNCFIVGVNYDKFWMFLTNLTHLACTLSYLLLVSAHCSNGDFNRRNETSSSTLSRKPIRKRGWALAHWRLTTGLYEFQVGMLLTVFFAFWLVEFPANFVVRRNHSWNLSIWLGIILSHTVPEMLVFFDWLNSCVRFEWRRFGFYFTVGLLVLIMNIIVTLTMT